MVSKSEKLFDPISSFLFTRSTNTGIVMCCVKRDYGTGIVYSETIKVSVSFKIRKLNFKSLLSGPLVFCECTSTNKNFEITKLCHSY